MCFGVTGVDHKPFKVRLGDDHLQELFPDSFIAPATKAPMRVFPIAVLLRQISPRSTGAQNPDNGINEFAIVSGHTAPYALSAGQMRFNNRPSVISNVMTVNFVSHIVLPIANHNRKLYECAKLSQYGQAGQSSTRNG
jgi:hypothetical protein